MKLKINKNEIKKKGVFFHFLSLFAPVDITIGAYSSISNHFQTSNQKSVLKNK